MNGKIGNLDKVDQEVQRGIKGRIGSIKGRKGSIKGRTGSIEEYKKVKKKKFKEV